MGTNLATTNVLHHSSLYPQSHYTLQRMGEVAKWSDHSDSTPCTEETHRLLSPSLHQRSSSFVRCVRRDLSSQPDEATYAMTLSGRDIVMQLRRNLALVSRGYTETHYSQNGTRVTSAGQDLDHCFYHGRILNDSESVVSVSICDGLRGYFKTELQQYLIEPLSGNDTGDHKLLPYLDPESTCGVTNTSWEYPTVSTTGRSRPSTNTVLKKYVELFLVVDNTLYQRMKRDFTALRRRVFQMVNFVNAVYQPLNTSVILAGLEVWTDRDRINVMASPSETLDRFTTWRNKELLQTSPHDNAQLITGIDFEGSTVGFAHLKSMCSAYSTGVVQDHNFKAIAVAAILAHEIGHNLGMEHDSAGCLCRGHKHCIMSAALGGRVPQVFSGCSKQEYEMFLQSPIPLCLFDTPDIELAFNSVCGNGILERGEECDCGTEEKCENPCCHASTCTLTKGSECATGECCKNCRFASPTTVCRSQKDDCDLTEFCTGMSAQCPQDVFSQNGLPCKGGQGYCRNGHCPLLAEQCTRMWGDAARVARKFCYEQNRQGTYYGFCRRPGPEDYIPCMKKDVMCGKLFCSSGSTEPSSGVAAEFSDCRTMFNEDQSKDQGLVETGTRCGDGAVCSNNQCIDLETIYGPTNCSAKCQGHAVCNHQGQCQCQPGWLPPDCEFSVPIPQIVTSDAFIAFWNIIAILGLLLISAAIIFIVKHRKNLSNSPRLPPQEKDFGLNNPTLPTEIYTVNQNNNLKNINYPNYPSVKHT
ncbi:hypothetical protein GJAV_G00043200 [Gymnothorax javanicus]|nr:hypothetical protein GJAV_G00043200 [Gymnothorax javanicus]